MTIEVTSASGPATAVTTLPHTFVEATTSARPPSSPLSLLHPPSTRADAASAPSVAIRKRPFTASYPKR